MKLHELTFPYEEKRVVVDKADHKGATIKRKDLQLIQGALYREATSRDDYGLRKCKFYAYFEDVGLGIDLGGCHNPDDRDVDDVIRASDQFHTSSLSEFREELDRRVGAVEYISNTELEFARLVIPERFDAYRAAIDAFDAKVAQERAARRAKRESEDAMYCKMKNEKSQAILDHAHDVICNDGVLENQFVSFYKSRHSSTCRSVINQIALQYGVNIPLKVQGWINNSLSKVMIRDAAAEDYDANTRSKTFCNYMDQVIAAVRGGDRS